MAGHDNGALSPGKGVLRSMWLFAVLAIAVLVGCSHVRHNIVGSWDIMGGPGPATISFTKTGNFSTVAALPGRRSSVTGQYHLDGDTLTLQTMQKRTATLRWNSENEAVMTGDDGRAMTIVRRK